MNIAISQAIQQVIFSYASEYASILQCDSSSHSNPDDVVDFANQSISDTDDFIVESGTISESDDDEDCRAYPICKFYNEECWTELVFKPPSLCDVSSFDIDHTFPDIVSKLQSLSLPECLSDFNSPYPSEQIENLYNVIVGEHTTTIISDTATGIYLNVCFVRYSIRCLLSIFNTYCLYSIHSDLLLLIVSLFPELSLYQLASIHSEKQSSVLEKHESMSFFDSVKTTSSTSTDHKCLHLKSSEGLSLNQRLQHVMQRNSNIYPSHCGQIIDPSASFDLITADCKSPEHEKILPSPSEIKDLNIPGYDSLTSALAQEYEECAVKAEYDHQLRLVQHLSSGFVRCTEMINQEPNSASRMTSKSPIPTPLISSTPAEKFF